MRVVHFSADAPAVDVALDGGDVVVANLAYPDAAGYLDLPEGEYDLEIRPTGTTDVAFDIDPLPLAGGTSYTRLRHRLAGRRLLHGPAGGRRRDVAMARRRWPPRTTWMAEESPEAAG